MNLTQNHIREINERLRKSSSTLREYFQGIENELVGNIVDGCKIHSLKMYKGSMGYVRTTHHHPIGQKCTGSSYNHIGEIGWNGRVQITFHGRNAPSGFGANILNSQISLWSGSGGYNGDDKNNLYKLNYDSGLFIKDLTRIYEQYLTFIDKYKILSEMYMASVGDNMLAIGIINNDFELLERINNMIYILKGFNIINQLLPLEQTYEQIIRPYYNVLKQREIWNENKNLGWIIKDEFFKYGSDDLNYL